MSSTQTKRQHKITLPLPQETWEAMTALAAAHQRSFTKELVWALNEYVWRVRAEQAERSRHMPRGKERDTAS